MPDDRTRFARDGFIILRRFFDAHGLSAEVDRALAEGIAAHHGTQSFSAGDGLVSLQYLPMMCDRTPLSLHLVASLSIVATDLLGRPVLPGRAKGTRYYGSTSWHRDSNHRVASLGCVAYLDALTAETGALRVIPGSHRASDLPLPLDGEPAGTAPGTVPGDVVVFDEHIIHGSTGGVQRRQWRTDFIIDPSPGELPLVRDWYRQSLPDQATDPGYDAKSYPSFGSGWRLHHPEWSRRMEALGILHPS